MPSYASDLCEKIQFCSPHPQVLLSPTGEKPAKFPFSNALQHQFHRLLRQPRSRDRLSSWHRHCVIGVRSSPEYSQLERVCVCRSREARKLVHRVPTPAA